MSLKEIKNDKVYTMKILAEEVRTFSDSDLADTYMYYKKRENSLISLEQIYLKVLIKEIDRRAKVCPKCKKRYIGYPALSREDNKTEICQDCGQREAMNAWIQHEMVKKIKKEYPAGTKILLINMNQDVDPIEGFETGIVEHVDDIGTIHCKFDNGRQLGLIVGIDEFMKI